MRKPAEFRDFPERLVAFLCEYKGLYAPVFGPYLGVIKHHVDGDTLDVYCDMGLNDYQYRIIRLKDLDAPELFSGDAAERGRGQAALAYLEALAPVGTPCVVYDCAKDRETFGRYEARIATETHLDLSRELRLAGHVKDPA